MGLESQLFEWAGWNPYSDFGDMCFSGIKMKVALPGVRDEDIDCIEWLPSKSAMTVYLHDGSMLPFNLKVSV